MSETQTAPAPEQELPAEEPKPNDLTTESQETDAPEGRETETETEPKPELPKFSKEQKRIDRLVAKSKGLEEALAEREKELERYRTATKPASDETDEARLERRAEERAAAILAKRDADKRQTDFNNECNRIAKTGKTEYGEDKFNEAMSSLWETLGKPFDAELVEAAIETGSPHKVLFKLGNDPEEAERIGNLSPARKGAALAKLAAEAPPPSALTPPPAQSRVPNPVSRIGRGGGSPEPRPDGTQEDFTKWYDAQRAKANR